MRTPHWIALMVVALPLPAVAQDAAAPAPDAASAAVETYRKRTTVVVYGNDPCPVAQNPDEIVVCARRPEEERFRLRTVDRAPGERIEQGGVGRTLGTDDVKLAGGTGSCSTVGPGGVHGCGKGVDLLGLGAWINSLITD